jgi:glycosyltransferase involved in cell wall biosynthesis
MMIMVKKRVVVAIESLGIGGAERALFDLITATHDIVDWTVWCRSGRGIHADNLPSNVKMLDCSSDAMLRYLAGTKPDVFINDIVTELIGLAQKIRMRVGKFFMLLHSPHPWSLQFIDEGIRQFYDGLIVVAPYLVDRLAAQGIARDTIHVVPNFVDTALFRPIDKVTARSTVGLPQDKFLFGYFGRADGDKRVHTMPLILKGLRDRGVDAKLVMVGLSEQGQGQRTEFWESVKEMIRAAASTHRVAEHVIDIPPVHNPVNYYAALDATILPSVHEGSPVFPIESLACGVPCIATDVGDLKDFLPPCTGSKIIAVQNMVEPLFVDELFRLHNRPQSLVAEQKRAAVSVITHTRSKQQWIDNRSTILKGVLL